MFKSALSAQVNPEYRDEGTEPSAVVSPGQQAPASVGSPVLRRLPAHQRLPHLSYASAQTSHSLSHEGGGSG